MVRRGQSHGYCWMHRNSKLRHGHSLMAIVRCNNQLHALVDRADHLREPILADIKFTKWKSPDISLDLRIPPRINGGRREYDSFSIHPRDRQARGRSRLVMSKGTSNIIPRALPVECNAYGVMLDSNSALIAHCNQWSHR